MVREFKPYPFVAKRHQARLPKLVGGQEPGRHPVLIVGAGPVGLTLALGLAAQGVRTLLVEADDSVCYGSRAICVSRRSLEILERLGAVRPFLEKGLAWTEGRSFYRSAEVLRFAMPQDENQKLPAMLNLQQYYIEQFMLDAAEARADLIEIRWATAMTGLSQDAEGVTVNLSTAQGDYAARADWVVACDGGRSLARESLGLSLTGESYEGRYVIVDIAIESQREVGRLAWFDPPSNPGSTILVHIQPDGVWRIDYQIRDDEDPDEAIKPENVVPRVQSHLEMMGETSDWRPIWITMYRAHALTMDRYRHDRVLFAGDAAHLVPIFGVRGANSGIDDADNLAWKLALVCKGLSAPELLDTYSEERVAAAHENLSYGIKSTEFMAPPNYAFTLMRTAVLSLAKAHPEFRSLINPRQSSPVAYEDSPLNASSSDPFDAGPRPGAVLAECPISLCEGATCREAHLTDLLSPAFTALWFTEDGTIPFGLAGRDGDAASVKAVAITRRRPLNPAQAIAWDHTGRLFPLYGAGAGALYLVRPDGHVLGRWSAPTPSRVAAAIDNAIIAAGRERTA